MGSAAFIPAIAAPKLGQAFLIFKAVVGGVALGTDQQSVRFGPTAAEKQYCGDRQDGESKGVSAG